MFIWLNYTTATRDPSEIRSYDDGKYRSSAIKVTKTPAVAKYDFSYAVNDEKTGDMKRHSEIRRGDEVLGSYFLIEPDGGRRLVEYTAGKNGFNARVQRTLYKNYHINWNSNRPVYTGEMQGLHTDVLTGNKYGRANGPIEQKLVNAQLLRTKYNFNWTTDDRYSKLHFLNNPFNGKQVIRNFPQRKQVPYNLRRVDQSQLKYADVRQRSSSLAEPRFNIDIRRAAPASSYFIHNP